MELDLQAIWELTRQRNYVDIPMSADELREFLHSASQYDPQIRWSGYTPVDAFDPTRSLRASNYVLRINQYTTPMATKYLRLTYAISEDSFYRNEHFINLDEILLRDVNVELDAETLENLNNFL